MTTNKINRKSTMFLVNKNNSSPILSRKLYICGHKEMENLNG